MRTVGVSSVGKVVGQVVKPEAPLVVAEIPVAIRSGLRDSWDLSG